MQTAEKETAKALALGIKEEIEKHIPEISGINEREGRRLGLLPELEHAVRRGGNYQIFSLGTPAAAGAAYAVTGSKEAAAVVGMFATYSITPPLNRGWRTRFTTG